MTTRHKYIGGSVLVALLGIGVVVYLMRRKPTVNVTGVIEAGTPTITYKSEGFIPGTKGAPEETESDIQRLIRQSAEAIRADDLEQADKL